MISHVRHRRLLLSSHNHYRCRCNTLEKAAHIIPTLKPARCQYHKDKALFSAVFFCCTLPYFCSQLLNFSVLCCLFFFCCVNPQKWNMSANRAHILHANGNWKLNETRSTTMCIRQFFEAHTEMKCRKWYSDRQNHSHRRRQWRGVRNREKEACKA